MFFLFNIIVSIGLSITDRILGTRYIYYIPSGVSVPIGYIDSLYGLLVFIPNLAVQVRRLHDQNKSGKLLLLFFFVPMALAFLAFVSGSLGLLLLLGFVILGLCIWLLVLFCMPGTTGPNKYGEDPNGGGFKFSFEEGGDVKEE